MEKGLKQRFYQSSENYLSTIGTDEPDAFEQTDALMEAYDVAEMYIKELELKVVENERKAKAFDEIEQVIYENTGLGEGDEDLVNYENLLDEIEIITNYVESEAD